MPPCWDSGFATPCEPAPYKPVLYIVDRVETFGGGSLATKVANIVLL